MNVSRWDSLQHLVTYWPFNLVTSSAIRNHFDDQPIWVLRKRYQSVNGQYKTRHYNNLREQKRFAFCSSMRVLIQFTRRHCHILDAPFWESLSQSVIQCGAHFRQRSSYMLTITFMSDSTPKHGSLTSTWRLTWILQSLSNPDTRVKYLVLNA